jgi:hypothetical protein
LSRSQLSFARLLALALTLLAFALVGSSVAQAAPLFSAVSAIGEPTGYAESPIALVGADGETAAVWREYNEKSSLYEVLLRRVAGDGTPATSTLTLSVPGYYPNVPSAALASNGTIGVFWQQIEKGTYQGTLRFVSVTPEGSIRATAQVGTTSASSPTMGLAADGSGWLAWTDGESSVYRTFVARVAPDGTVGTPLPVSADTHDSEYPQIAVAPDGAAWLAWVNSEAETIEVAYAPAGGEFGAPQTVPSTEPYEYSLSLGIDARGDGILAYTDDPEEPVEYTTTMVRLPAGGAPSTPVVLDEHDTYESIPSVGVRPDGSGMVAWNVEEEVHARTFNADGTPGPLLVVSNPALAIQSTPRAVVSNDGRATVIWWEDATSIEAGYQVKMREYDESGPTTGIEPLSGELPSETPKPSEISAGYGPDGTFNAAWTAHPESNLTTQIYMRSARVGPANETPPTVSATSPVAGQTLTGQPGTWSGTGPLSYSYRWLRCTSSSEPSSCLPISGATALTYTATAADVTAGYLRLEVTASNEIEPDGVSALSPAIRLEAPAAGAASGPAAGVPAAPVGLTAAAIAAGLEVSADGTVQIPLSCPATTTGCDADGTLSIALPGATAAKAHTAAAGETVLAQFTGVQIAAGHSRLMTVRLQPAVLRRLQRQGVRRVRVTLRTTDHLEGQIPVNSVQQVWLYIPPLTCALSHRLTVHWVLHRGVRLRSITIASNGRTVARPAPGALAETIVFRAKSPSVTRVTIAAVTSTGRRLVSRRVRLLCGGKLPAGYHSVKTLVLGAAG